MFLAEPGDPLTPASKVPMGIDEAKMGFLAINQHTVGKSTRFTPVGYYAKKWRKARLPLRAFTINTKTPALEKRSRARAEQPTIALSAWLRKRGVVEPRTIKGGFTGRYRINELKIRILLENDQLLARTTDLTSIKTTTLVKKVSGLLRGRCNGKRESRILHVVSPPGWNAVAVYLETTCDPENPKTPMSRVRRLVVRNAATFKR
jgi:hypothetical protein